MDSNYFVAVLGIGCTTAIELASLAVHGPDSTVTAGVVGSIAFMVGLCFGRMRRCL